MAPVTFVGWIFTLVYLWSHTTLLAFLITWPLAIGHQIFKKSRLMMVFSLSFFSFLQMILFIDTFVFQQYRFHINLFVLELLFKGQGQVISFPWYLWAGVLTLALLIFFLQSFSLRKLFPHPPRKKTTALMVMVLFIGTLASHFIHMLNHAAHNAEITRLGRLPAFAAPWIDPRLAAGKGRNGPGPRISPEELAKHSEAVRRGTL
jgi:membrane-anchored protein YejM (alkaline phosphatase superfamily)